MKVVLATDDVRTEVNVLMTVTLRVRVWPASVMTVVSPGTRIGEIDVLTEVDTSVLIKVVVCPAMVRVVV